YNIILSLDSNHKSDDYKIIYEFKVEKELKINNKKSNSFNIYIVGSDFAGMMDLNMIATINQDTHKILLTSIPRDYYIEVAGYNGTKDKLSFITQGVDVSMESLELLFDTDIDYYLKIDTNSLVTLVDQIGGIEYCSDVEFTTTHAQVLNTYNDSYGRKLHVVKGCQHLNGVQTLTVARERNAFPGRDRVRQQNCQKIMIAIFKKIATIDTIGRYNDVLNAVSNSYDTNISRDIITSNIKDVLNNGNKWTIETQSVDGSDGHDRVHLNTAVDWVMYPNMDTVNTAKEKINNIMK
ncbi:MAG: LCP family protein, partial [Bacilli bacterium]|nr:LCP family protein [Bacilli bacterium]